MNVRVESREFQLRENGNVTVASVKAKRLNKYLFIYIFHKLRFSVIFLFSRPVEFTAERSLSQFPNVFECVPSVPFRIRLRGLGAPGGIEKRINCSGGTEHSSVF